MTSEATTPYRPWSPLYIGVIAYFCFLLPGIILMGLNFRRMGNLGAARRSFFIGIPAFLLLLLLFIYAPAAFDGYLEATHIAAAFLIAAIPYPAWNSFRKRQPDVQAASLLRPALWSILFLAALLGGNYAWIQSQHARREALLLQAKSAFDRGEWDASLRILKEVREVFPDERLGYVNSAIAHESAGRRDSARVYLDMWLNKAPEDAEAQEMRNQLGE